MSQTLHQAVLTTAAPAEKIKGDFTSHQGHHLTLEYNGGQFSFRIGYRDKQRLFFFEPDTPQKTLFRNEYGLTVGQLTETKENSGGLRVDGKRYGYKIDSDKHQLLLCDPRSGQVLLSCNFGASLPAGDVDARLQRRLAHCLLFSFAWMRE